MKVFLSYLVFFELFLLIACTGNAKVSQGNDASAALLTPNNLTSASAEISAQNGGYVNVGSVQLKIPAQALNRDQVISAELADIQLPSGSAKAMGKGIKLKPEGLQFLTPAELEVCYGPNDAVNLNESQALIYYQTDDGQFIGISGTVDLNRRCVRGRIEHFSSYVAGAYEMSAGNPAPQFTGINFLPQVPMAGIPLRVRVQINDSNGGATPGPGTVAAATLKYRFNGGGFQTKPLLPDPTDDLVVNRYFFEIPASEVVTGTFEYAITATDNLNQTRRSPVNVNNYTPVTINATATALQFVPATYTSSAPLKISAGFSRQLTLQATADGTNYYNISAENVVSLSSASLGTLTRIAPSAVRFSAVGAGAGQIIANVGSLSTSAYLNVVPGLLTHIEITDTNQVILTGTLNLPLGLPYDFDVIGFDNFGNIASILPTFTPTPGIGTVSVDALTGAHFNAATSIGSGSLVVDLAGLTDSISISLYEAPRVTATAPGAGTPGIALDASIGVSFSHVMIPATITTSTTTACVGTIQVSRAVDNFSVCVPMVSATPTFFATNTLAVIVPAVNLQGSTEYQIRVTNAAFDTAGHPLAPQYLTIPGFMTVAAPSGGLIGQPDPSFGGPNVGSTIPTLNEGQAAGVAVDAADNSYVTGYQKDINGIKHMIVYKFNSTGAVASGFASTGVYTDAAAEESSGGGVIVDASGNILVTGYKNDVNASKQTVVWRLLPNGTLDGTFGSSGTYALPMTSSGFGKSLALDSAGRILVTARNDDEVVLFRLTTLGSLDTTFASGSPVPGTVTAPSLFPGDEPAGIRLTAAGEIFVSGWYIPSPNPGNFYTDAAIWKFTAAGIVDTSFGNAGVFHYGDVNEREIGYDFVIESSGRLLLAGIDFVPSGLKAFVVAVNSNGTLDTTYGTSGVFILNPAPNSFAFAIGTQLDSSGRLIVTGPDFTAGASAWRLTPAGALDLTFGFGTGRATFGSAPYFLGKCVLDSQGRIVSAGYIPQNNAGYLVDTLVALRYN